MTTEQLENVIVQGIRGLSPASLGEVADFVLFLRRKALEPEAYGAEQYLLCLREDLKRVSEASQVHLEVEFKDYDQRYPRE